MKLTQEQLTALIHDAVKGVVPDQVKAALEPVLAQQTNWMEQVRAAQDSATTLKTPAGKEGFGAARFVRAMAFGRGDVEKAVFFAKKAWDDDLGAQIVKALQAGDFTAGGAIIPDQFAAEVIDLLRARSVVRAAQPRTLPMPAGTLTLRKRTGGSTASYVGESQDITKSEPTTGRLTLTSKKLAALVPISNDLLNFASGPGADEFVRDDLVQQISTREDQAFLRDSGVSDTPKGMRNWAVAANVTATNGTTTAQIESDFRDAVNALEQSDVPMIRPVWFMAPRSKNYLRNLRDSGNLVFDEIRKAQPTLYGWPVFTTTNIPTNLGAGTNETEVYLVDMSMAVIAESTSMEIAVDSSASYIDNGTLVSAFSRDETLMRAITRHDFGMLHDEAVAVKNAIVWGA